MVESLFVANLLVAMLGLGLCLSHAWPDRERLALLATTTVYGVLLEQLVILRFERYVYNVSDFLVTLGDVPLVIGFGWAAIIYSGLQVASALGLPDRVRPFFVGLYALHIDLAIDAIAIRVPFWSWTPPGIWFGVPLGNFMGWFLVATLFAAAWVGLRRRISNPALLAVGSLLLALVGLMLTLELWEIVARTVPQKVLVLGGVVLVASVLVARSSHERQPLDWRLASIPFLYHGAYLGYFLVLGLATETPVLGVIGLLLVALSVLVHAPGRRPFP